MNTKKMTEGAVLSALFVICTIIAISTGLGYTLYLDIIVPILVTIVYIKLDYKYMILMCISTFLITIFTVGDVVSAIWLVQGMLIGFICSLVISRKTNILDDFIYASILGTFVMILIDVYFQTLTGYSFIKDAQNTIDGVVKFMSANMSAAAISKETINSFCYILIASLPMGTILVVYIAALFFAKKLRILKGNVKDKYLILGNFRKIGAYISFSREIFNLSIIYTILIELIKIFGITIPFVYLRTVLMAIEVIAFYVLIKDSYSFVMKYMVYRVKARKIYPLISLIIFMLLISEFKITIAALVIASIYIDHKMKLREKQAIVVEKFIQAEKLK